MNDKYYHRRILVLNLVCAALVAGMAILFFALMRPF